MTFVSGRWQRPHHTSFCSCGCEDRKQVYEVGRMVSSSVPSPHRFLWQMSFLLAEHPQYTLKTTCVLQTKVVILFVLPVWKYFFLVDLISQVAHGQLLWKECWFLFLCISFGAPAYCTMVVCTGKCAFEDARLCIVCGVPWVSKNYATNTIHWLVPSLNEQCGRSY